MHENGESSNKVKHIYDIFSCLKWLKSFAYFSYSVTLSTPLNIKKSFFIILEKQTLNAHKYEIN